MKMWLGFYAIIAFLVIFWGTLGYLVYKAVT